MSSSLLVTDQHVKFKNNAAFKRQRAEVTQVGTSKVISIEHNTTAIQLKQNFYLVSS